jgi:hypothetical protein
MYRKVKKFWIVVNKKNYWCDIKSEKVGIFWCWLVLKNMKKQKKNYMYSTPLFGIVPSLNKQPLRDEWLFRFGCMISGTTFLWL